MQVPKATLVFGSFQLSRFGTRVCGGLSSFEGRPTSHLAATCTHVFADSVCGIARPCARVSGSGSRPGHLPSPPGRAPDPVRRGAHCATRTSPTSVRCVSVCFGMFVANYPSHKSRLTTHITDHVRCPLHLRRHPQGVVLVATF